ncbi:MAG: H-NS family nucleoid-associated regulatory protein [Betaproteobacteria bacterium]|jgi:DNA-binding protein H-NS
MARSYDSIRKQIARLQAQAKALENARDNKKARAVERVKALMKKLGVSMEDMSSATRAKRGPKARRGAGAKGKTKSGGATVAPKYRDPETGATWTGRGRPPVWMAAKIAAGQTKEQFLIPAA